MVLHSKCSWLLALNLPLLHAVMMNTGSHFGSKLQVFFPSVSLSASGQTLSDNPSVSQLTQSSLTMNKSPVAQQPHLCLYSKTDLWPCKMTVKMSHKFAWMFVAPPTKPSHTQSLQIRPTESETILQNPTLAKTQLVPNGEGLCQGFCFNCVSRGA